MVPKVCPAGATVKKSGLAPPVFFALLQRQAYANNRNLLRPKVRPPYQPLPVPGAQENAIIHQIEEYRLRRGFLQAFEDAVVHLHHNASSNQFELGLTELAKMIGLLADRHDNNGEGPDVLWLLPSKVGIVIEAKSRKKEKNALTKKQHGQLLVAAEWFAKNYPNYKCVRTCVHPKNKATKAAVAEASHALTYEKISALVSDARVLLTTLCESKFSASDLVSECSRLLKNSPLNTKYIVDNYLIPFEDENNSSS